MNEFYMFHGTNPKAAQGITDGDFRIDLAGSNAGTLYGRGVYFAESVSKSDEYGSDEGAGLNPMLVCRVVLGRVNYQDAVYPNTDEIVNSCVRGEYNCVLDD